MSKLWSIHTLCCSSVCNVKICEKEYVPSGWCCSCSPVQLQPSQCRLVTGDERPASPLHREHGGLHDSLHRQRQTFCKGLDSRGSFVPPISQSDYRGLPKAEEGVYIYPPFISTKLLGVKGRLNLCPDMFSFCSSLVYASSFVSALSLYKHVDIIVVFLLICSSVRQKAVILFCNLKFLQDPCNYDKSCCAHANKHQVTHLFVLCRIS